MQCVLGNYAFLVIWVRLSLGVNQIAQASSKLWIPTPSISFNNFLGGAFPIPHLYFTKGQQIPPAQLPPLIGVGGEGGDQSYE